MKKSIFNLLLLSSVCFAGNDSSFVSPNNSSYSQSTITVTASAVSQLISANPIRKYLLIQNKGSSTVAIKTTSTIDLNSNEGIFIIGGGNYEPIVPPTNSIYSKSTSGSQILEILEGN